ncbi:hypothetical protein TNCV_4771441 [Trichonephila clavipes]|nr:hypothetical protein TNCV_4771441 [Trichonephila clavipes]
MWKLVEWSASSDVVLVTRPTLNLTRCVVSSPCVALQNKVLTPSTPGSYGFIIDEFSCQIETHEIDRSKGLEARLWLAVALSTVQVAVLFGSVIPQFCGRTSWRWSGASPPVSLPLPRTTREDWHFDGYLAYPHAAKALLTSMPSPGFEPWPYGTAVSVTKLYTGWVPILDLSFNKKIDNCMKKERWNSLVWCHGARAKLFMFAKISDNITIRLP